MRATYGFQPGELIAYLGMLELLLWLVELSTRGAA
jgi:hypothetical protein